jgi:hypothetical protein
MPLNHGTFYFVFLTMIPQELVDAIVNEIDAGDKESLKTCSLAGSPLRDSSQRILLSSLTLRCDTTGHNYDEACAMLTESPRIAGYMTRLNMLLPSHSFKDLTAVEDFRLVLDMLPNVRRCDIRSKHGAFPWYQFAPGLEPAIIYYISHHTLTEVHVSSLNVRPDLLFLLVSRVPTLTLDGVRVTEDADTCDVPHLLGVSLVPSRILQTDSDAVCGFLSRPDWAAYSTNLTCLVVPLERHVSAFLVTTAFSLEHLRFHCNGV